MGAFGKVVSAALFVFFLVISVVAPLMDVQTCLPHALFPSFLLELKTWYAKEYDNYLVSETPNFFVGIVWLELVFQWPLAIACVYGIAAGKSWLSTTCLLYGVSTLTSMEVLADDDEEAQSGSSVNQEVDLDDELMDDPDLESLDGDGFESAFHGTELGEGAEGDEE